MLNRRDPKTLRPPLPLLRALGAHQQLLHQPHLRRRSDSSCVRNRDPLAGLEQIPTFRAGEWGRRQDGEGVGLPDGRDGRR